VRTEIEIAREADFADAVAAYSGDYVTDWTPEEALELFTPYFVRARVEGLLWGLSEWSAVHAFTTVNASLGAPVIVSPADGAEVMSPGIVVETAAPEVVGQTVTLKQVQVSVAESFEMPVWDSGQVAYTEDNRTTVGATLAKSTTYRARARFFGPETGWTEWSAVSSFTTAAAAIGETWVFAASGTFIAPLTGAYKIECVGGGGGACGNSASGYPRGSGGGGGYALLESTALTAGQTLSCTVGGGGAGVVASAMQSWFYGGNGGTSSVGALASATGGGGGSAYYSKTGSFSGSGGSGGGRSTSGGANGVAGSTGASVVSGGNSGLPGWGAGGAWASTAEAGQAGMCRITFLG
jgi:hypothetical protein